MPSLTFLIATALFVQCVAGLLVDDVEGGREPRPWEEDGAVLVNAGRHDDVPLDPPVSYNPNGDITDLSCGSLCPEMERLLDYRHELYVCCDNDNTIVRPPPSLYYHTTPEGIVLTNDVLRADISNVEMRCPACVHRRNKRSLIHTSADNLWTGNTDIAYVFQTPFTQDSERTVLVNALADIAAQTCFTFTEMATPPPVDDTTTRRVVFTDAAPDTATAKECSAFVGRSPFEVKQLVSLMSRQCFKENNREVYRQLLTTLGVFPDTYRFDRDQYVDYFPERVKDDQRELIVLIDETFSINAHTPFDYGSLSNSNPTGAMSISGSPIFEARDPLYKHTLGSSFYPSFLDFKQINDQYCQAVCTSDTPVCLNGGYHNPSSTTTCDQCLCPSGYSGATCELVEPRKGDPVNYISAGGTPSTYDQVCTPGTSILEATGTEQSITSPNYDGGVGPYRGYRYFGDIGTTCNWIIRATTPECFVKVRFADEFDIPCQDGTCIHSVEIKHKNDKTLTGPRFCCNEKPTFYDGAADLQSEGREIAVLFNAELGTMRDPKGFKMYYQEECTPRPPFVIPPAPSQPIIEDCREETPFTACSGIPASDTATMTQTRTVKCQFTGANGAKTCSTGTETRTCTRCQVLDENVRCTLRQLGQCFVYDPPVPTFHVEFCKNPSYGIYQHDGPRTSVTDIDCPAF